MKTHKISVNKTAEQPAGLEIEIVAPETPVEERVLCFLLISALRDWQHRGTAPFQLPQTFDVKYRSEGAFMVTGFPGGEGMYEPPKPLALVGVRVGTRQIELIHAPIVARPQPAAPQPAITPPAPQEQPSEAR